MPGEVLLQLSLGPKAVAAQGTTVRPALCLGLMASQLFLSLERFPTLATLEEAFGRMLRETADRWRNLGRGFRSLDLLFRLVLCLQAHFLMVNEGGRRTARLPTVEA